MNKLGLLSIVFLSLMTAPAMAASYTAVDRAFDAWDLNEVEQLLGALAKEQPQERELWLRQGRLAFERGIYPGAMALLDLGLANMEEGQEKANWEALRAFAAKAHALTKEHQRAFSADGRVMVLYPPKTPYWFTSLWLVSPRARLPWPISLGSPLIRSGLKSTAAPWP